MAGMLDMYRSSLDMPVENPIADSPDDDPYAQGLGEYDPGGGEMVDLMGMEMGGEMGAGPGDGDPMDMGMMADPGAFPPGPENPKDEETKSGMEQLLLQRAQQRRDRSMAFQEQAQKLNKQIFGGP